MMNALPVNIKHHGIVLQIIFTSQTPEQGTTVLTSKMPIYFRL